MRKKSNMGFSALVLLGVQGALVLLEVFEIFPYMRTLFFPAFVFMAGMIGMVGYFERDEAKGLALVSMVVAIGMLTLWTVLLIGRLNA